MENDLRVLDYIFSWMKKGADQAVGKESNWSENIKAFATHLLNDRRLSTTTAALRISVIRKFLRANKVHVKEGPTFLPKKARRERDRIPTRQELKQIFVKAELREKALILFSLSSGLGVNSLRQLRFQDIDLEQDCPSVNAGWRNYSRNRLPDGFLTFVSPKAKQSFLKYLEEEDSQEEKKLHKILSSLLIGDIQADPWDQITSAECGLGF